MQRFFTTAALVLCVAAASGQEQQADKGKYSIVHIGLVYPLSTNGAQAADYTNGTSFHAIVGVSGNEEAFCASGITSIIRHKARGAVISGFSGHVGEGLHGVQASGFLNTAGGRVEGVQASGFLNVSKGLKGVQAAGFGNMTQNAENGMQAAGFINVSYKVHSQIAGFANMSGAVQGVQAAGFINAAGNVRGSQVAGFANISHKVHSQVAGFINVAEEVKGVQVAGFINVAKRVKGPQIAGFINIAEKSDYPIGIINIIKEGEKGIGLTIDETATSLLAFRSGGRILYGIIGAGFNLKEERTRYALEAGIGAHLPLTSRFRINAEAVQLGLTDFKKGEYAKSSLRILPALKFGDRFELFAGPSINYTNLTKQKGEDLVGGYLWKEVDNNRLHGLHIGGLLGMQVLL